MMKPAKTLYLIDGTAYIHRAYHAIAGLSNSKGLPTNAIFGFTRMMLKLLEGKQPEYIAVVFDSKGPTFRHDIYKEYKANRPPMAPDMAVQIPYIKDISSSFNISVIEKQGFEADDLIGTLAAQAEKAGFSVIMVTGDKDFLQLVSEHITIWDPMKEKTIDLLSVRQEFNLEPYQMIDMMGLSGDTSDNVPGVPGIGTKTALSLIQKFGSMKTLYERIHEVKQKKQHENLVSYKDQAWLSRQLVTICKESPISFDPESFKIKSPDKSKLAELFKELEFRQLQKDFPAGQSQKKQYQGIYDNASLMQLIKLLETSGIFALDTETTSENPMLAELVGLSFSIRENEAFYIPCAHKYPGVPEQLRLNKVLSALRPVLENPNIRKIGQNIKYDWTVLKRHGILLGGVAFDTMVASYLVNPSKRAHNLDQIALDFLDYKKISYEETAGKDSFEKVPVEKAVSYSCEDADITLCAANVLKPMLNTIGLDELMNTVEMPLIPVLMAMEMRGICVDKDKLRQLSKNFEHQLEQMEKNIYAAAGESFNIKSSQQLGQILFEKLNLPVQKKTKKKTGYSTDVEVLTQLAAYHELPALILSHRGVAKLKSTYTDALLEQTNSTTGRVHTSYNQTVTATGRLSSSDPNLQNIPIRTEEGRQIRSAFIPQPGWVMLSADYSQIELRLLAHYADDPILIKAFTDDEDIHTRTAAEVFQLFPEMVTPELRRQAKTINFGIIYGMGAFSLSKELGISVKMAQTYIEHYFRHYKGVKSFIDDTIETARASGKTSTLLGRIRLLPDMNSSNHNVRAFAERTAVNTPIQGTAADLIKLAMIKVDAALREKQLQSAMLLSVHDELVFEVPPEELEIVKTLVKDIMENVWQNLRVPLRVNVACGENWAEAH
jgi:DNA polymerase-1